MTALFRRVDASIASMDTLFLPMDGSIRGMDAPIGLMDTHIVTIYRSNG